MAEAAAARREARRRRILENSQNRLQLISGKASDESPRCKLPCGLEHWLNIPATYHFVLISATPVRSFLLSEDNYDVPTTKITSDSRSSSKSSLNNGVLVTETETLGLLSPIHDVDAAAGDSDGPNDFAGLASEPALPVRSPTLWEKLITYRLDIVILSLLIQLFYSLSIAEVDNVYFFLPLAIYVVTKLALSPVRAQSSILNALLMMQGLSPDRVQKLMFFTQLGMTFSQDVCVFLFTTICIQSLYITMSNKIVP